MPGSTAARARRTTPSSCFGRTRPPPRRKRISTATRSRRYRRPTGSRASPRVRRVSPLSARRGLAPLPAAPWLRLRRWGARPGGFCRGSRQERGQRLPPSSSGTSSPRSQRSSRPTPPGRRRRGWLPAGESRPPGIRRPAPAGGIRRSGLARRRGPVSRLSTPGRSRGSATRRRGGSGGRRRRGRGRGCGWGAVGPRDPGAGRAATVAAEPGGGGSFGSRRLRSTAPSRTSIVSLSGSCGDDDVLFRA